MKNKENVLQDFKEMIYASWTYAKMNEAEKKQLEKAFSDIRVAEALKGTYEARWGILQAIYSTFLHALYYTPNWRETREEAEKRAF